MVIPESAGAIISLDFVSGLAITSGYDPFRVIVDYLTQMGHLIPNTSKVSTSDVVLLL